ncbi:iron-containing redox enzyme family protein [Citricoccus sp. NPDC055426]|uniref:iron-containing redox enzyme family protein n=1 Tax=Citricoccus sp. NPDC055426 TaxID=3155536 RepID=UPI00341DB58C
MKLPLTRGPVTYSLWPDLLSYPADRQLTTTAESVRSALTASEDILYDEDLQLALFCLYELHYSGVNGVDERWEWDPALLAVRHRIESAFEARLRRGAEELYGPMQEMPRSAQQMASRLFEMSAGHRGPSVVDHIDREATEDQVREALVHQSVHQLREADPQTWAIPRLHGRAKSALVEIQVDGYAGGRPGRMYAELFAAAMTGLGLKTGFGDYLDRVPALSLAAANTMSLFGLHRRLRGAVAGHLAFHEMASPRTHAASARGLRRLGFTAAVTEYFDAHVTHGAAHEQIAGCELAGRMVEEDPALADDVWFGAASAGLVDRLLGRWQLEAWHAGRSSLRTSPSAASVPRGEQVAAYP